MLTVDDLLSITSRPDNSQVSLKLYQEFYDQHLCNRVFGFQLKSDDTPQFEIELVFEPDQMCHLLGIQYVVEHTTKRHAYVGQSGYDFIKDGTLSFDELKNVNRRKYKSERHRILYFPFIYQILQNPRIVEFDKAKVKTSTPTRIDVDVMCYNHADNKYLHLGLTKRTGDKNRFFPRSFFDRGNDAYIADQTEFEILNKTVRSLFVGS